MKLKQNSFRRAFHFCKIATWIISWVDFRCTVSFSLLYTKNYTKLCLTLLKLRWENCRLFFRTRYTTKEMLHWQVYNSCALFWCTTVGLLSWHGAALPTRCHSACCWSNVAPSTAVCIVIRSCGASNTSFNDWRQSLCGCWTTSMEQFTWVRHRLLVTSHLQEISQCLFI